MCQRSLLHNVLYQISSLHLQDSLDHSTTKFHRVSACVCFFRPGVLGVMTAAHVKAFVKTLAVGHECLPFSHQHSCRSVSFRTPNSSRSARHQLISTTRLKHLHFRHLPRLTALDHSHTKRPHVSSNCVASSSAARTNLRPLYNFWFVLSLTSLSLPSPRPPQRTRNSEPGNRRSVVSEQTSCSGIPFMRQHVTSIVL